MESHSCSFPFSSEGSEHHSCQPTGGGNVSETRENDYCYSQVGDRHVFGFCDEGCYDVDKVTPMDFEGFEILSTMCKTQQSECQFPFVYLNVKYTECTNDGSDFFWCALQVDGEDNLVGNRWGKCDMSTCSTHQDTAQADETKEARAIFSGRVEGLILFSQESSSDHVKLQGKVGGLDAEEYTLKISDSDCDSVGSGVDLGGDDILTTSNNSTMIDMEKWGMSLHDGDQNIVGGSVRLVETVCAMDSQDCNVDKLVACANIVAGNGKTLNVTLILVISLVIFSVLLVILTVILVICCIRRFCPARKQHDEVDSMGSIDDIYRDQKKSKTPLYDELSIPFIDASLPPTPKVGRSSNPLEILLGRIDGSRTSLNDTPKSGN